MSTRVAAPTATACGAELAGPDLGGGDRADERAAANRLAQRLEQQLAEPREPAAEDHERRVHEVEQTGDGDAQVLRGFPHHLQRQRIAGERRVLDGGRW